MARKRVLIVCGGKSAEHEVSLVSALSVARALDKERFEPLIIGVDRHETRRHVKIDVDL